MQERKIIKNSKSWRDLDRTLKKLIKNKKAKLAGSIFEHLTKLYLEVSPEYKSKLTKVYLLNEVPTNLKKKLELPNTDEGIDLIAETFDKEYWAIQCKYRSDNTETLKVKGDLATFNNLAFTVCKNISHGIVCATVNRPPKKTKLLNSIGFELLTTWLGLDRNNGELFKEIKSKAIGKIERPKKLNPRPHQIKAIKRTIDYFKSNERGKMIMPCGTGKSLTAFWIAEKMKPKSILVAVPSLALLQQTLKVWTREFLLNNIEPDWLCVCSDDTVKEEQDDFVTSSSDLGIKVDTDPRVIRNFLKKKTNKLKIVFTTYQSGRATAIGSKGFVYDLGIMDEAHKTVGSKSKEMAHLLHQKNIKINKRLFMTATERLFKGDSDEYMSMDDPRDYGNLIYELSFKEAINSNPPIISDYKIITFGITTPEIEKIAEDNKYLEVKKDLKDITARELATAIALRKAIKKLKIKNAISFHRSIKRAENFRKQQDLISKIYPTYGKLKTFHVRGDMPTSDRALEMLSFEEEQGLMTNARCLTEGVDLPAIDCVCFTDPKRSKVDIVQAAGRALRLSKGKKFGYILIPIFIPDGIDFDTAAEAQGFDDVSITVRALASTDKRIVEYLRSISEGKKPSGGSPVEGITSVNQLYQVEAEKFNKAIQLKVWDKVAVVNWRPFHEARDYVRKLKLKSSIDWQNFCRSEKKPKDIPTNPGVIYSEFIGLPDFCGYEAIIGKSRSNMFVSYIDAKKIAKKYNINQIKAWSKFARKNYKLNIPVHPDRAYKEFISFEDFFEGRFTSVKNREFLNFHDARKFVHKQKIKSLKEWMHYRKNKKPSNIPTNPNVYYQKDWTDWGDFLGTGTIASGKIDYRNYEKAKIFAQSKKLKTAADWLKLTKSNNFPSDIPKSLPGPYKDKWENWSIFLNSGGLQRLNTNYKSFIEAKKFLKKFKFENIAEWKKYKNSNDFPNDIPKSPDKIYKREWKGLANFIGSPEHANKFTNFRNFKSAKILAKSLSLKSRAEWLRFKKSGKLPKDIPAYPNQVYKKQWKGWDDFLYLIPYYSYEEAKAAVKKYKFLNFRDFRKRFNFKKDPRMPLMPPAVYRRKKTWKGWPDFWGKKSN
jgi:superfamily II DNA or RNA helicase